MNTRFKVFTSSNILQYLCDFIHVLIFVTISKCRKSPKLTNIVLNAQNVRNRCTYPKHFITSYKHVKGVTYFYSHEL